MKPDLSIDEYLPPLHCHFLGCSAVWMQETRRHVKRQQAWHQHTPATAKIEWHHGPSMFEGAIIKQPAAGTWLALSLEAQDLEVRLPKIYQFTQNQVTVAVIGPPQLEPYRVALTSAGAVALVTSIFDCDKLARVICRLATYQIKVITGWKTRFVNRIPWPPVQDSNA